MGGGVQKACLKILAVRCSNHVLNTDLAPFEVAFYKRGARFVRRR